MAFPSVIFLLRDYSHEQHTEYSFFRTIVLTTDVVTRVRRRMTDCVCRTPSLLTQARGPRSAPDDTPEERGGLVLANTTTTARCLDINDQGLETTPVQYILIRLAS